MITFRAMQMKKGILFIIMIIGTNLLIAQVPDKILNQFKVAYPEINDVKWNTTENGYSAFFHDSKKMEHLIYYDGNGQIKKKENEVTKSDIPYAIVEYCKRNYPKENSCKLWLNDELNGKKTYRMDRSTEIIYFDLEGNYLNKKKANSVHKANQ